MNPDSKKLPLWSIKHLKSPVDGIRIRYATRLVGKPKRRILFLNGRSDWIEKYEGIVDETALKDTLWVMMDHRGQGASEGLRSHVRTYDHFARDVAAVAEATFKEEPFVLIAHSMGGLIAMYATLKGILEPKSMILFSPLFGLLSPIPMSMTQVLAFLIAHSPWSTLATGSRAKGREAFDGNPLTQCKTRFQLVLDTPYAKVPATFGWLHATFVATRTLRNRDLLKNLRIPIAIMVGENETVVDKAVYGAWVERWQKATGLKASFEILPGAQHELLNEADRYRKKALAFITRNLRR